MGNFHFCNSLKTRFAGTRHAVILEKHFFDQSERHEIASMTVSEFKFQGLAA